MTFKNLKPEESKHITLFIKYFIEENRKGRWETILSMKPEKWVGLSAYDCNQPVEGNSNKSLIDIIQKLNLEKYLDHEAYIFPIGHGAGKGVYKGNLRNALLGSNPELECIISIIPGKLAVSYGHSNEFRLCKK